MIHLPDFISDLAIILAVAGAVILLFKKIGQPVVLGYLVAGFLVGPEVSFLPTVQDREGIKVWAEIGVIVLLFGLGLEFSFRKLAAIGRGASITAITEIISMFGIGYLIGYLFGWNSMDSIFLGGILSISSTTIIIRAIDELGYRKRKFVNLVFGVLIVEDLIAILLMVLLSTIAVSKTFEGVQLITEAVRLGFFLTVWFLAGIFLIPWFLRKTRSMMNDETTLIVSLGLCLLMVLLATKLGFSPALGAFIMGSIFAETSDGHRIEHSLKPVRDLFAAIFFVSVGMLIQIDSLREHWFAILAISLATIFGKLLTTTAGAILAGQSLRHSIQAGMSLAQIGEFSFIIATLGLSLGVISGFLYPVAVAVSAITTFTTPYMIRLADPLYELIERKLPAPWKARLDRPLPDIPSNEEKRAFHRAFLRLFANSVIVIAIALATSVYLTPMTTTYISLFVAIILSLPFLWAISSKSVSQTTTSFTQEELRLRMTRDVFSFIARNLLSVALLGFVIFQFTSALFSFFIVAALTVTVGLLGVKNFSRIYHWLETRFLSNLNEKEAERLRKTSPRGPLAPWDAHLTQIQISPDSSAVGQTLSDLKLKEHLGVMVTMIERGKKQIFAPGPTTSLMPFDQLFVLGTDEQISSLQSLLEATSQNTVPETSLNDYGLYQLILSHDHRLVGQSIRTSGLREKTLGLVVGIERAGARILNPDPSTTLQASDRLWIVGKRSLIEELGSPLS